VGYESGDGPATSALIPFAIDAANLRLVLTPQLSLDFTNGAPVQMQTDPKDCGCTWEWVPAGNQPGQPRDHGVRDRCNERSLDADRQCRWRVIAGPLDAIDPQGRFFYDGWGERKDFWTAA